MRGRLRSGALAGGAVAIVVAVIVSSAGQGAPAVFTSAGFWGTVGFLWGAYKGGGASSEGTEGAGRSQAIKDGEEYLAVYPLICQKGEDAQALAKSGQVRKAKDEVLSILEFLVLRGIIDQFMLAKCFLALLAFECKLGGDTKALLRGSLPGELGGTFGKPTLKAMEVQLISVQDQALFDSVSKKIQAGEKPDFISELTRWDFRQVRQESLSVIKLYTTGQIRCICNIERANPPKLKPGMENMTIDFVRTSRK